MKTKLLTFVTLVVTVFMLTGCNTTPEEVAKEVTEAKEKVEVDFGTTMDEVKSSKSSKLIAEDKDRLVYEDKFSDYNAYLMYVFNDSGKLKDFFISFTDEYESQAEYNQRFLVLKTALEYLHGEPKNQSANSAIWELENKTTVLLTMDKNDGNTRILYSGNTK
jgi:hypothetical protein